MRHCHPRVPQALATSIALAAFGLWLSQCSSGSGGHGAGADSGADATRADAATDTGLGQGDGTADSTTDTGPGVDGGPPDAAHDAPADAPADSPADALDAAVTCDAADACAGSLACCSGLCADLRHDPRNCGSCGNACTTAQFCTGQQCDDTLFSNVGANPSVTVVEDPFPIDIEAGVAIGTALAAITDGGLAVVPQTQAGVLIPEGDAGARPNTGVGTTLVAGGSWFGQTSVAYMDSAGLTPIYMTNDGTTSHIYQRATGLALVTAADSTLTSTHDYFLLELAVEPQSGTMCLFGEGILGPGTAAAGYYGSQVVVPGRATYTAAWYVYEWTDTSGDGVAGPGDTFTQVALGP